MRFASLLFLSAFPALLAANPIDDGFRHMYNLQFDNARKEFAKWQMEHPGDPLGPVSEAAAYLFSELDRLHILQSEFFLHDDFSGLRKPTADAATKQHFDAALEKARQLSAKILAQSPSDPDATFAETMRLGLHADYLALIEKKNIASLGEVKQGRQLAEKLLTAHPGYYDAYLAVGLENYILSLKPMAVRFILRIGGAETDRQTGIDKLRLTAEKGRYLLPYARLLLAVADLRDGRKADAKAKLTWLSSEFPLNQLYKQELAKLK